MQEQAISPFSSSDRSAATVFISTGFLRCPHLKAPEFEQGLETNLLSSVNRTIVMGAYRTTLSSRRAVMSQS